MSDETTVKFNLAFAEPLGCYTVSVVAFLVAMIGLGMMTLGQGEGIFTAVAVIFLLGAFISYLQQSAVYYGFRNIGCVLLRTNVWGNG